MAKLPPNATPMMKQYFEIKKQHEDAVLMFRLGDFYEMFFDDAKLASKELELVLTGRDWGQEERAPMCGVPFHSADSYIARLVANGHKVAICEQTEDPATAKGLVSRDVIRIITPGTVIENSMLDEGKNNYLACVCYSQQGAGVCFSDVSTGSLLLTQLSAPDLAEKIINEMGHYSPSEVICNSSFGNIKKINDYISDRYSINPEVLADEYFSPANYMELLQNMFPDQKDEIFSAGPERESVRALGGLLIYLREVQKNNIENLRQVEFYTEKQYMSLDVNTRRNLELTETIRNRDKKGSLLWVLDKTKTPMGKRLMRAWLDQPLMNIARITKRQNSVAELFEDAAKRQEIAGLLSNIHDMERLMTRIIYATANAKELRALRTAISFLPQIKEYLKSSKSLYLKEIYENIDLLKDVESLIDSAIVEDPPFTVREGGMIKDGYNGELDELRAISNDSKAFITSIQVREIERTGIKKLKVGYNRVFGYYLEVPNSFKDEVPGDFIRKQTLTNCECYITQELKELEAKVLAAQERIVRIEYELFEQVRTKTAEQYERIQRTSVAIAELDVFCSLAHVAVSNNYTCPEISAASEVSIKDGRHPVVEQMLEDTPFVPNDALMDCNDNRCVIITGPNMAGKSTFMRQVALIVLMAQIGSFVPASFARIGIVDAIFTRIGASDDLAGGQSTFMVEMSEVASILRHATSKSLIVFDEIGRGTSTYDGMSIARAVLEFAADKKKLGAKTLFATHYHELTELENHLDGIKNYNIAVKKRGDEITFLRRIVSGGADESYGIEVAMLAGVPGAVVSRAKIILKELEDSGVKRPANRPKTSVMEEPEVQQFTFEDTRTDEIIEKLKNMDVNTITPIEALKILYELVKEAGEI